MIVVLLLAWLSSFAWAKTVHLTHARGLAKPGKTRIVLVFDASPSYKIFRLTQPNRVALDLSAVQLATRLFSIERCAPILRIRHGYPRAQVLRLVFELPAGWSSSIHLISTRKLCLVFSHKPIAESSLETAALLNTRDIKQALQAAIDMAVLPKRPRPALIKATGKPVKFDPERQGERQLRQPVVVVIDPGHGGKDSGTVSRMGVREKDVVLLISRRLQRILRQKQGFKVLLTRNSDIFIPLRRRLEFARRVKAEMFIAIHADAFVHSNAKGASVFALSARGASSEAAYWLATKENHSEFGGTRLSYQNNTLRSILINLAQTATITSSLRLGKSIIRQLSKVGKLHRGFVEQAPFVVLKSPDIPSLLIETGFLSNSFEERRLNSPSYQQQLATALAAGISNYFRVG